MTRMVLTAPEAEGCLFLVLDFDPGDKHPRPVLGARLER